MSSLPIQALLTEDELEQEDHAAQAAVRASSGSTKRFLPALTTFCVISITFSPVEETGRAAATWHARGFDGGERADEAHGRLRECTTATSFSELAACSR